MKHEIDGAIIKAATRRTRNIACLKSAGRIYRSVNQGLMHRICLNLHMPCQERDL